MADWYYIGHYGQLGPLTAEQIEELVQGGVIARDTYVWRTGMTDWLPADRVSELQEAFRAAEPYAAPPPPPSPGRSLPPANISRPYGSEQYLAPASPQLPAFGTIQSDRSRTVGGILQIVLPGVGRMYLGYAAIGVLQLFLVMCGGIGALWSIIDGIIILTGGVRLDGYGRHLPD